MSLPPDGPPPTEFEEPDFSPDPEEAPPVSLGSAVGDVPPFVTVLLLLACGIVFAVQAVRGEVGSREALIAWGGNVRGAHGWEAAWRLLASTFLHGGALHLLLNAISLLIYGSAVEAIFSSGAVALVWVVGGALASESSLVWRESQGAIGSLSVGASGAIFALAGAVIAAAVRLRGRLAPGRARALAGASLFLVVQSLSSGIVEHATDNAAHLGGLVAGGVLGAILPLAERLSGRPAGTLARVAGSAAGVALFLTFAFVLREGLRSP